MRGTYCKIWYIFVNSSRITDFSPGIRQDGKKLNSKLWFDRNNEILGRKNEEGKNAPFQKTRSLPVKFSSTESSLQELVISNDVKYGYNMPSPKKTRAQGSFTWPEDCFYCGAAAQQDRKNINRRSSVVRRVQSLAFKQNVLSVCDAADDSWSNEVRLRVINCHDFVAVKARYHLQCHDKFNVSVLNQSSSSSSNSNNQSLLTESLDISKNAGRPIDPMKHSIRHT